MEKLFPDLKRESMEDSDGNGGEEDDAFYEEIEAPKFVDFTVSDHHRSRLDDPSWFCVRVGCDQMHEMVDPEALHKSFVLRVMAARSPNVRLRKVLYNQSTNSTPKCPKSAPQKPANDRVLRFSRITSVHEKMCIAKIKEHPISSLRSTTPKKLDIKSTPRVRQTPKSQKSQVVALKTTESSATKNTAKSRICTSSKCATLDAKSCKQERTPLSVKKKKIEEISRNIVSVINNNVALECAEEDDKENAPGNQNTSNMNLEKAQAQKEKCKKMKPTNPKPFRLRTDERGILREANLERKLQNSAKKNITTHVTTKQGDETQSEKQQKKVKFAATPSNVSPKKNTNTNMKGKKKKATTIPKEPNFQRIHLPKGCTKRQEQQPFIPC